MNQNEQIINKYYESNSKFTITKKKKNVYIVKDGLIGYFVTIDPLKCPCAKNMLCNHIIFLLENEIKINLNIIKFIHRLPEFCQLLDSFQSSFHLNSKLTKIIKTTILNDDCGICTIHIGGIEFGALHECTKCGKFVHKKCLNKWLAVKDQENKTCIYCNSIEY